MLDSLPNKKKRPRRRFVYTVVCLFHVFVWWYRDFHSLSADIHCQKGPGKKNIKERIKKTTTWRHKDASRALSSWSLLPSSRSGKHLVEQMLSSRHSPSSIISLFYFPQQLGRSLANIDALSFIEYTTMHFSCLRLSNSCRQSPT